MIGFECSITVTNIDLAIRSIESNGGRLAAPKSHIPTVSPGGIPKFAIPSAESTETGVVGDAWRFPFHGGRRKAILLIQPGIVQSGDAITLLDT